MGGGEEMFLLQVCELGSFMISGVQLKRYFMNFEFSPTRKNINSIQYANINI